MDGLLTLKEVSERTRTHPSTWRRLIARGLIPTVRLGGKVGVPGRAVRLRESDVAAVIAQNTHTKGESK